MQEVLAQYCSPSPCPPELTALGGGNINDTWLVRTADDAFILQRLNRQVFPHPELITTNLLTISRHLAAKQPTNGTARWRNSALISTLTGSPLYTDRQGHAWRALSYIDRTVSHNRIGTSGQARQVGWALGHFHHLLADLPADQLYDSLPGFHVLPQTLAGFDQVVRAPSAAALTNAKDLRFCTDFVANRRAGAVVLEQARQQGVIGAQVIHGDPKVANVLFDAETNQAVSLIDLDTVGPGLVLYDIGDCLRSCCNTAGEEVADYGRAQFDLDLCEAVLDGYLTGAGEGFSRANRSLIYAAVHTIAFELGLRFLTDYLAGNVYFKVQHEGENLHRALVQFHLVLSIEQRKQQIEMLVKGG